MNVYYQFMAENMVFTWFFFTFATELKCLTIK